MPPKSKFGYLLIFPKPALGFVVTPLVANMPSEIQCVEVKNFEYSDNC